MYAYSYSYVEISISTYIYPCALYSKQHHVDVSTDEFSCHIIFMTDYDVYNYYRVEYIYTKESRLSGDKGTIDLWVSAGVDA